MTCMAHAFHRIAEKVRASFPLVDEFVAATKQIFKKSPSRILVYKTMNPDLPLPPEAVITRWGTWLNSIAFFTEHFDNIKKVYITI
jgi:hypothetical protein